MKLHKVILLLFTLAFISACFHNEEPNTTHTQDDTDSAADISTGQNNDNQSNVTPPSSVTSLFAEGGDRTVTLTWTEPTESSYAGVLIKRSSSGAIGSPNAGESVFSGKAASFTDAGLENNTTYYYSVFSFDNPDTPTYSTGAQISVTPFDDSAPAAVVLGPTSEGDNTISLSWTNPSNADFSGIVVRQSTEEAFVTSVDQGEEVFNGSSDNLEMTNLANGKTLFLSIYTYDDETPPNYSTPVEVALTPVDQTAPAAVSNAMPLASDNQVTLQWTNPTDADFEGIILVRSNTSFPTTIEEGDLLFKGNATEYQDQNLTNKTDYYYSIFSYDDEKPGNYSPAVTIRGTPVDLVPPSIVKSLQGTPSDNTVNLSWNAPDDADVAGYVIMKGLADYPTLDSGEKIFDANTTSYEDPGLTNKTPYYYSVYAYDDENPRQYSAVSHVTVTPIDTVSPGQVSKFKAVEKNGGISLYWKDPNDADLTAIKLVRKPKTCPLDAQDGVAVGTLGPGVGQLVDASVTQGAFCYAAFAYDDEQPALFSKKTIKIIADGQVDQLDNKFGNDYSDPLDSVNDGINILDWTGNQQANAVATDPTHAYYVVGSAENGAYNNIIVWKFNDNGQLSTSFGQDYNQDKVLDGYVILPYDGTQVAESILLDDIYIYVGGYTWVNNKKKATIYKLLKKDGSPYVPKGDPVGAPSKAWGGVSIHTETIQKLIKKNDGTMLGLDTKGVFSIDANGSISRLVWLKNLYPDYVKDVTLWSQDFILEPDGNIIVAGTAYDYQSYTITQAGLTTTCYPYDGALWSYSATGTLLDSRLYTSGDCSRKLAQLSYDEINSQLYVAGIRYSPDITSYQVCGAGIPPSCETRYKWVYIYIPSIERIHVNNGVFGAVTDAGYYFHKYNQLRTPYITGTHLDTSSRIVLTGTTLPSYSYSYLARLPVVPPLDASAIVDVDTTFGAGDGRYVNNIPDTTNKDSLLDFNDRIISVGYITTADGVENIFIQRYRP